MRLVHKDTGVEVLPGDVVTDFRGDTDVVDAHTVGTPPHKSGSTGKVYTQGGASYPSVYGLEWRA